MSDLVPRARAFAETAHAGQTRKNVEAPPYITHCAEVAALVNDWGADDATIAAAWLHDTVEDCAGITHDTLTQAFGPEVAGLVAELTDDRSRPKAERKALQLANAPHKSPRAALVKLADKTSNLRSIAFHPPAGWPLSRRHAYLGWAEQVVTALPACPPEARRVFDLTLQEARAALAQAESRRPG